MKQNITILIRVYNRIEDIVANLKIIKSLWKRYNESYIIVSFNGKNDGYDLPEIIYEYADKVVELENNLGHLKGNSQLIREAYDFIPDNTEYLILLEADTWLLDDSLIEKYIGLMKSKGYVWCSSKWSRRSWSLGLDLAILDFIILKKYYHEIFNFNIHPEQWVCDTILKYDLKFCYIKELMPVHIPKILLPIIGKRRANLFLKGKMLTHHIEELKNGIKEKYAMANCLLESNFFQTDLRINCNYVKLKYFLIYFFSIITPNSSWFKKKKHYFLEI